MVKDYDKDKCNISTCIYFTTQTIIEKYNFYHNSVKCCSYTKGETSAFILLDSGTSKVKRNKT